MARVEIQTVKEIQPEQLKDELNGCDVFTSEGKVQAEGCTEAELQTAVDAHTPNPDYGKPAEETSLKSEITQRLQALDDATKTKAAWDAATAAQRQEATRQAIQVLVRLVRFISKRFL